VVKSKNAAEMDYWSKVYHSENQTFGNSHYEYFFTGHFNMTKEDYNDKRILDIGCGPRGSLEWADNAQVRIGIDPLANEYMELGISSLSMTYVLATAEYIPFPDNYFDAITSFNSIDHVDDLILTIKQIKSKLKPNGMFLLITDVNHDPTPTEPISIGWDIVLEFEPEFELVEQRHYERKDGIYESIYKSCCYDHNNITKRYGVLSAKFIKRGL
jgi:ubiquinone/menaquinone biosynthesis C-methylase UbiE